MLYLLSSAINTSTVYPVSCANKSFEEYRKLTQIQRQSTPSEAGVGFSKKKGKPYNFNKVVIFGCGRSAWP